MRSSSHKKPTGAPILAKVIPLCLVFFVLASSCGESKESGPTLGKSGTVLLDHSHDGFPHYIGDFKAVAIESESLDHNTDSFTQGLEWDGDLLIESTGRYGQSALIQLDGGEEVNRHNLDDRFFAEGLTKYQDKLFQLTLEEQTVLVYDSETLEQVTSYEFEGEGWGLCHTENHFVMSSGPSTQLSLRDLDNFKFAKNIDVTLNDQPLDQLNELECSGDQVWANIYKTNTIVAINLKNGEVEATVDASDLVPKETTDDKEKVLNGIAIRPEDSSLWLTGKNWPKIFKVELVPVEAE